MSKIKKILDHKSKEDFIIKNDVSINGNLVTLSIRKEKTDGRLIDEKIIDEFPVSVLKSEFGRKDTKNKDIDDYMKTKGVNLKG